MARKRQVLGSVTVPLSLKTQTTQAVCIILKLRTEEGDVVDYDAWVPRSQIFMTVDENDNPTVKLPLWIVASKIKDAQKDFAICGLDVHIEGLADVV